MRKILLLLILFSTELVAAASLGVTPGIIDINLSKVNKVNISVVNLVNDKCSFKLFANGQGIRLNPDEFCINGKKQRIVTVEFEKKQYTENPVIFVHQLPCGIASDISAGIRIPVRISGKIAKSEQSQKYLTITNKPSVIPTIVMFTILICVTTITITAIFFVLH